MTECWRTLKGLWWCGDRYVCQILSCLKCNYCKYSVTIAWPAVNSQQSSKPVSVDLMFEQAPEPEVPREPGMKLAQQHQSAATAQQKHNHYVRSLQQHFNISDPVWVYCPIHKKRRLPKLDGHWRGPQRDPRVPDWGCLPPVAIVLHRDRLAPYCPLPSLMPLEQLRTRMWQRMEVCWDSGDCDMQAVVAALVPVAFAGYCD